MNRRILFLLSICFVFCAACASQPKPAPRAEYEQEEPQDAQRAQLVQQDAQKDAERDATPAAQQGLIDLGLDGGDDPNGAAIVINRPDNGDTNLDDIDEDAETEKIYERECEEVAQCEGLEALSCEGEMACVENQCVYTCEVDEDDEDVDADDLEDSDELDEFDDVAGAEEVE